MKHLSLYLAFLLSLLISLQACEKTKVCYVDAESDSNTKTEASLSKEGEKEKPQPDATTGATQKPGAQRAAIIGEWFCTETISILRTRLYFGQDGSFSYTLKNGTIYQGLTWRYIEPTKIIVELYKGGKSSWRFFKYPDGSLKIKYESGLVEKFSPEKPKKK